MIAQTHTPSPEGNVESSTTNVLMVKSMVALNTRAKNYDSTEAEPSSKGPPPTSPPTGPLMLEKMTFEPTIFTPKGYFDGPPTI